MIDPMIFVFIGLGAAAGLMFVLAGAVLTERPAPSNAHDMLNLFGITPDNAHEYMH
ncbi:hypothetical protein SEA_PAULODIABOLI_371 [Microbacterium phage PauloDiaboli]|nr:hypothetical protein SEA_PAULODIABOLI_16 [Microbacterium phage PauloDiaboli]QIG58054.1 hypothetical protein SEA_PAULODIABOLI_371 [Microbacterium phage PauloDiaboli]